jgi:hypothetical protein
MERECFMKKYAIALLTLSFATSAFAGPGQQDTAARSQAAGQVMNEIMAAPDKGIPDARQYHSANARPACLRCWQNAVRQN